MGRLPDVDRLRAALAVRDLRSVTSAADQLGLTQPAVSRLVSLLEADLGFALFARERRRLVLTERGRSYLSEAEASLGALQRLSALGRELRVGARGGHFSALPRRSGTGRRSPPTCSAGRRGGDQ